MMKDSITNTHVKYLTAREELNIKMTEVGKIHVKAKGMANLAHQARNNYKHAMYKAEKLTLWNNYDVAHTKEQLKVWKDQMVHNEKTENSLYISDSQSQLGYFWAV